jgi:hypothetical protein
MTVKGRVSLVHQETGWDWISFGSRSGRRASNVQRVAPAVISYISRSLDNADALQAVIIIPKMKGKIKLKKRLAETQ